ncbi:MAG TPA: phosphohistidine phosphatase SixA [Marinagarivorans sp.]
MELLLLRHGHAQAYAERDQLRPLSELGRAEIRSVASQASDALLAVETVWVSPYLRAQQTYEELRSVLPSLPSAHSRSEITPGGQVMTLLASLEACPHAKLLLITHQPFVGDLLDALCGFDSGRYFMGTACLAALSLPSIGLGQGDLQWFKQPSA